MSLRPEKLTVVVGTHHSESANHLNGVVEVPTFLGPIVRLEVIVHGQTLWVDVSQREARGLERKKPVVIAFEPGDAVVIPRVTPGG